MPETFDSVYIHLITNNNFGARAFTFFQCDFFVLYVNGSMKRAMAVFTSAFSPLCLKGLTEPIIKEECFI